MKTFIAPIVTFSVAIFLMSCAAQRSQVWEPYERSGLGEVDTRFNNKPPSSNLVHRFIPVSLDPKDSRAGKFDLYYFVRMPTTGKATKTVLYCAGGPGEIVEGPMSGITTADFLTQNGFNVVFFHERGAGFSQIPASNQYDKFLRTSYAVEDMEAIRRDFLGENGKWDAIIGWSYGTVVAQQYAHFYPDNVERLIMIGPMSRHKFKSSADAFDEILREIRRTERYTLDKIYQLPEFADLSTDQKNSILDKVFGGVESKGIFDRAEEAFGSIGFVIDSYCELRNKNELANYMLDNYSREFFIRLRDLRMFGWRPRDEFSTDDQLRIGHRIKEEILYTHLVIDDCAVQRLHDSPGSSKRAFYGIGAYDGINMPFLREWVKNGKQHVIDALKKSGGEANELRNINKYIEKIGITDTDTIEPWDPAQYKHGRPTLILKGSADSVTAGGAAEYFFREALTGVDGTLIEFPGIGHALITQEIFFPGNILSGTVRIDQLSMAAGETRQVLGRYKGRDLDENFRMELTTDDLQSDLKLAGFGIVGKNQTGLLDVVALIENKGNQILTVPRKWKLDSKLFQATASLDPETISPGTKKEVSGRIESAWGKGAVRMEKPPDLEPNLDSMCAHVRSEPDFADPFGLKRVRFFEIWIRNNSTDPTASAVDGEARSWTVSTGGIKSTFSVDPDPLGSQEVSNKQLLVESPLLTGLSLREESIISLEPGTKLLGCIQEEGDNSLSIAIYNPEAEEVPPGPQTLTIDNSIFTRTYHVNLPEIEPLQAEVIKPTNPTYNWKNTPVLNRLSNVDPALELRGWYVVDQGQVAMLLRRNSQNPLAGASAEWVYIDPNENSVACQETNMSRNCLIYSFLVMSPEAFKKPSDNKVLAIIKESGANICHRNQTTDDCP